MEVSVLPVCLHGGRASPRPVRGPLRWVKNDCPAVCVCVCLRVFEAGLGEGNGCPPESAQARLGHTVKYTDTKSSRALCLHSGQNKNSEFFGTKASVESFSSHLGGLREGADTCDWLSGLHAWLRMRLRLIVQGNETWTGHP